MYKCKDCGNVFDEGEEQMSMEHMGECHGFPAYEKSYGCPHCGGNYEEIEPCKICGSYEVETSEEFCEDCVADMRKKFDKFLQDLTDEEKECLNIICEGGIL